MQIYVRLKELRKSKGYTQKQLANILKISERNYQNYEYGKLEPNLSNLSIIADYLDCSVDYLLGRTDNPNSHKL